ncbi:gentisate 1,2-dioxygenase [Pusillimonas noertemannii]|uniref:Gentisate 1,2-dioxygenase n=1 Tax=Pusillimonas noertemannii TaxID=305977 RepID=A0A2U1CIG6_9BURK|nr:gentisate 1,2-dioxygenase [Pusillimonas noertemannii]NYT70783.1 gentisate 1,2-dioxygenase [Pusillimonas noertemannii]PVY60722.1 gentisate 1,2-dioxygenase [Pusillimonas noertemannii]TFL08726.1 gentisate 1,2-dioxygenase [Pusillimonas noertemannii]
METLSQKHETPSPERQNFYRKISGANVTPLWEVLHSVITAQPNTPCVPYLWKWQQMRPWLLEAGSLITAQEAERRVLVLENPGLRGKTRITHSLYAGLQLIMPGEIAPVHRHSQSALRFIMEGEGAYTAVSGEKVTMNVGDFVITPSWTFHDHGNTSGKPMVWLDGLDLPIVELLDAQFMEKGEGQAQQTSRQATTNLARFGNTMKPVEYKARSRTSPLFWYPYERTRDALETLKRHGEMHPCWGHKLQYTNPVTGDWAIPTIGTFMQLLPAGFSGAGYRSTDSTVYSVVEGQGRCRIAGQVLEFGPKDVFICPSWMPYSLEASEDTVLFSYSDRPVQQALDLWREAIT